jgi:Cu(I)/Ag(I) efflux system membrane fusion protein
MFAEATAFPKAEDEEAAAKSPDEAPLVIPITAPLFTGRRAIVYVEVPTSSGAKYRATTVRLGPRRGSVYPVVAGLSEGQRVVTRGAFAIDADLQIRGGSSMMNAPDDREPSEWEEVIELPRQELRKLAPVVTDYLMIQAALAADDLPKGQAAASELGAALDGVVLKEGAEARGRWAQLEKMLRAQGAQIQQANSIEQARKGFEGLSGAVVMLLRLFGNPLDQPLRQAHCPMARGSEGASWVQLGEEVNNSYFGSQMLTCGDITRSVPPGGHLGAPDAGSPSSINESTAAPGGHAH